MEGENICVKSKNKERRFWEFFLIDCKRTQDSICETQFFLEECKQTEP